MNIFSQNDLNVVQDVIKKTNGQSRPYSKKDEGVKDEVAVLNDQSEHIRMLIEQIENLPDATARDLMQECIQEILGFYGNGLERILKIISDGNSSAAKD